MQISEENGIHRTRFENHWYAYMNQETDDICLLHNMAYHPAIYTTSSMHPEDLSCPPQHRQPDLSDIDPC